MFKAMLSIIILALTLGANFTYAASTAWTVSKVSGKVVISVDGKPGKWLELGEKLYPGDRIKTLSNGTVALTRDAEAMIISSDAQMDIPKQGNTAEYTTIVQRKGTILFSVKKKANRHFKIKTPFAAAIVKGTTFAINANVENMQVQVFEGSVALSGAGRSRTHLVTTGIKYLMPANVNRKIVVNRVVNAAKVNPHFGNDIEKLTAMYIARIEVKGRKANKFTSKVFAGNRSSNGNSTSTNNSSNADSSNSNRSWNGNSSSGNSSWNSSSRNSSSNGKRSWNGNSSSGNSSWNSSSSNSSSNGKRSWNGNSSSGNSSWNSSSSNSSSNGKSSWNSSSSNSSSNGKSSSGNSNSNGNSSWNSSSSNSSSNGKGTSGNRSSNGNSSWNNSSSNSSWNGTRAHRIARVLKMLKAIAKKNK